jgi:uncharacterized integral membrane protein
MAKRFLSSAIYTIILAGVLSFLLLCIFLIGR